MDQTVVAWKAFYSECRVYLSTECSWRDIPTEGIQIVLEYFADRTRRIVCGENYYWYDGVVRVSSEYPVEVCKDLIKYGTWLSDAEFEKLQVQAMTDNWRP